MLLTLAAICCSVLSMNVPLNAILTNKPQTSCVRSCREGKTKYGVKDYTCGFSCLKIRGKLMRRRIKRDTGDDKDDTQKKKVIFHIFLSSKII